MMIFNIGSVTSRPISEAIEWAKQVEDYGFDSLAYTDDMMYKPGWPLVFAASQHTSRIELGVTVSNAHLTYPAMLAMYAAMLDEMSNGRGILGIGRGHLSVFDQLFKIKPEKPLKTLREAIEMSKRLWRGDKSSYEGEVFYASEEAYLKWNPMTVRADIPVLVGAYGPKAVTMAGGLADRVLAYGVWDTGYANMLQQCIIDGAHEAGRNPNDCQLELEPIFIINDSAEATKAQAREDLAVFLPLLSPIPDHVIEEELLGRINDAYAQKDMETVKSLISDELLGQFCLYGDPSQIIDKIEEKAEATGVTRFSFDMPFETKDIDAYTHLLGQKVMPYFLDKR